MIHKTLGRVYLVALGIDAIVGVGIYLTSGAIADLLGGWSVFAFLGCGLLLSTVALTFRRLSELTSRNGGPYVYVSLAFGPKCAFPIGWMDWIGASLGAGAMGGVMGEAIAHSTGNPWLGRAIGGGSILVFGMFNYFGIIYGGRAMLFMTALKLVPLFALAVGGLLKFKFAALSFPASPFSASGLSKALMMTLFACQGFEVVPTIAAETENPKSTVPYAVLVSLWFSIILYSVLQLGVVALPGKGSANALVTEGGFLWGKPGEGLIQLSLAFSVIAFIAGRALAAPRFLTPLSEDGFLPRALSKSHERYGTPANAILVTTLMGFFASQWMGLDRFISLSALAISLQYLVSALSLFVISRREKVSGRLVAAGAVLMSILFLTQAPAEAWVMFVVTVLSGWGLSSLLFLVPRWLERVGA